MAVPPQDDLRAYAELILSLGVNLQPGQLLAVDAQIEHAPLARELAEAGYARGARYVDVWYYDPFTKRARTRHAPEDSLSEVPPWIDMRYGALGDQGAALVKIHGDPHPGLLHDVPQRRAGLDRSPLHASLVKIQTAMRAAWCIVPYPTDAWALTVYGRADAARLWRDLRHFLRLDQADPVAAWHAHVKRLTARSQDLDSWNFAEIEFDGPGTDLRLRLIPGARWAMSRLPGPTGRPGILNMPTEEIYTSPDFRYTEGTVAATRPLALRGTIVENLRLTFEGGNVTDVRATAGADAVTASMEAAEGSRRIGELALVDGTSLIGRTGRIFSDTLLDENATCHLAWGSGFPTVFDDWRELTPRELTGRGINPSTDHVDFMVGGPGVTVTGVTARGKHITIIEDETWCLPDRDGL